jgi:hypothetical protein
MKKLIAFFLIGCCTNAFGQNFKEVNFTEFIRETQQWNKENNRLQMVWWLPAEYWKVSLSQTNTVSSEAGNRILAMIKDYVLICTGDMTLQNADLDYKSKEDVRKGLSLIDDAGRSYYPLADNELSQEATDIEEVLKPMFASLLGQMGKGMHVFYFKIQDSNGKNILDAYAKENFKVLQGGRSFTWHLPLVTLLPSKFCPIDQEKMKGNWNFCPVHGVKLN